MPRVKYTDAELTPEAILSDLKISSLTSERVDALQRAGLMPGVLADVLGITVNALRQWTIGRAEPKTQEKHEALDTARYAWSTLIGVGQIEPPRATQIMTSIPTVLDDPISILEGSPAISLLSERPKAVREFANFVVDQCRHE